MIRQERSARRDTEGTHASVRAEQLLVVVIRAKPAHGISRKAQRKAMRTYVALSLIASANALAAPTTTPPKAPLPFTSPKKVDEALRKNDPLLHLASRLIRDVNARRGVRSVYAWCRRADDVADEAGVDSAQALARLDEIEADLRAALEGAPRRVARMHARASILFSWSRTPAATRCRDACDVPW